MKVIVKSSRGRSRFVLRTLLFTLLALAIARTNGEEMLRLISYTNIWKYSQDGVQAPAGWHQPAFNDSTWLSGAGVFGFPLDEPIGGGAPLQTVLSIRGTNGIQELTRYYLRTQFV